MPVSLLQSADLVLAGDFEIARRGQSKDRESRSTRRVEVFLQRQDGREIRTLVTNFSNRGCQLKPQELFQVDELVRIEVPRVGSVAATIRWTSDGSAGAEFLPQSEVWEEVPRNGV